MAAYASAEHQGKNFLLSMLSAADYRSLSHRLTQVPTAFKETLFERNKPIPYACFPCNSVHSVLAFMQGGGAAEVGTIGNQGFTGINVRMSSKGFQHATAGGAPLRRAVQRHVPAYLSRISQSVACNRLHKIEERFARWLLMPQDRVNSNAFHLAQEFLADMHFDSDTDMNPLFPARPQQWVFGCVAVYAANAFLARLAYQRIVQEHLLTQASGVMTLETGEEVRWINLLHRAKTDAGSS